MILKGGKKLHGKFVFWRSIHFFGVDNSPPHSHNLFEVLLRPVTKWVRTFIFGVAFIFFGVDSLSYRVNGLNWEIYFLILYLIENRTIFDIPSYYPISVFVSFN